MAADPTAVAPRPIRPLSVIHVNVVHEDFDATVLHYQRLFDARVVMDRLQPVWHACLVDIGRVLFEVFAPNDFFLHTRWGPYFLGIEFQVADMLAVRELLDARGIRIARDLDVAVHTNPADCHGVSLEFYTGYFHDNLDVLDAPMGSPEYWRDEHPMGFTGLKGCAVAVVDLEAALEDLRAVLDGEVVYEEARPDVNGRAVGLQVADAVLELIAPDGRGPLLDHLLAQGEGILSTIFGVRDLGRASDHLRERGVQLVPGWAPGRSAIPPAQNRGVTFEFAES